MVASPSAVPADLAGWARYDAVILADVPAEALPPGAMDLAEKYVRDLGRGLVMAGGPESFGPGGYADTPVERALPVYMDLRGRGRQPAVAITLVIDHSGSMSGAKLEMAKEAAARSIRLLREADRAAVLAFDSVPQWVAPLTPLTEREKLEKAVGRIYAGGGTEIYPALLAGFESPAERRGGREARDPAHRWPLRILRRLRRVDRQMREARITLSTVGVGERRRHRPAGGDGPGRPGALPLHRRPAAGHPEIFTRETIMATRTVAG